jgi:hypothetical protein
MKYYLLSHLKIAQVKGECGWRLRGIIRRLCLSVIGIFARLYLDSVTRLWPSLNRKVLWIQNHLLICPVIGSIFGRPFFELRHSANLVEFLTSISLAWIPSTSSYPWPGLPQAILAPLSSQHFCENSLMLESFRPFISLANNTYLVRSSDPLFIIRNEGQHTEEVLAGPLCPWMPLIGIWINVPATSLSTHTSCNNPMNWL